MSTEYLELADYLAIAAEINGWSWKPTPSVDDAEQAVLAIASGDWDQDDMTKWLRRYLSTTGSPL